MFACLCVCLCVCVCVLVCVRRGKGASGKEKQELKESVALQDLKETPGVEKDSGKAAGLNAL